MKIGSDTTKLRKIRLERGLGIDDLATKTGMSYSGIGKLDRGERAINTADALTVYKLAQALSVRTEDLLEL